MEKEDKKDYGHPIAARINTPDYNLLCEILSVTGKTRSKYLGEVLENHFKEVRYNSNKIKKLQSQEG